MAHWPLQTGAARQLSVMRQASGAVTTTTTITASATPHTKGPWTTVIAATSGDVRSLALWGVAGVNTSATDTAMLLDIGIGPAASEQVVLADYNVGGYFSQPGSPMLMLPLTIPDGSRIAARIQAKVISDTFALAADTFGGVRLAGPSPSYAAIDTYGTDAANSRGTAVVTGAINTFGSWTQIVASTTNPLRALFVSAGQGGDTVTAHTVGIDLGVGGAGVEQTLASTVVVLGSTEQVDQRNHPTLLATPIPAGQRLSVRTRASAATKTIDVSVHGLRG